MRKVPTLADLKEFKDFKPVEKTLGDIVDEVATNHPNKEALICDESRLTFLQIRNEANKIADEFMSV